MNTSNEEQKRLAAESFEKWWGGWPTARTNKYHTKEVAREAWDAALANVPGPREGEAGAGESFEAFWKNVFILYPDWHDKNRVDLHECCRRAWEAGRKVGSAAAPPVGHEPAASEARDDASRGADSIYDEMTDAELAGEVRLLLRSDPMHEAIVCAARTRIMKLSADAAKLAEAVRLAGEIHALENSAALQSEEMNREWSNVGPVIYRIESLKDSLCQLLLSEPGEGKAGE